MIACRYWAAACLSVLIATATGSAARASPVSWQGSYSYSQSLGRDPGDIAIFVDHRLSIMAGSCRIVAQGYQTNDDIICMATAEGDKLHIAFVSYRDGRAENSYGIRVYQPGIPLFTLERVKDGLQTIWQGYAAISNGTTQDTFKQDR